MLHCWQLNSASSWLLSRIAILKWFQLTSAWCLKGNWQLWNQKTPGISNASGGSGDSLKKKIVYFMIIRHVGILMINFKNKRYITVYTLIFFSPLTLKSQYQIHDMSQVFIRIEYISVFFLISVFYNILH